MSTQLRRVGIVFEPEEVDEAPGVRIRRTIGSEKLIVLDPFLLLDHLYLEPTSHGQNVGFKRHPHRGIETLTYVYAGSVHHKDSRGNDEGVGAGAAQWMTAGAGIFHEEMLSAGPDGHEALQLWFNLPAAKKFTEPSYQAAQPEAIPEVLTESGATVRIFSGRFEEVEGAFKGISVNPTVLDIRIPADRQLTMPIDPEATACAYVIKGAGDVPRLQIYRSGDLIEFGPYGEETRLFFVAARPLAEPLMQYRSLVMNTVDQMADALEDLANGTFERM